MQNFSNEHHNQTTDGPYAASYEGRLSLWFPTKQSHLSIGTELETRTGFHLKLSESQYQEHESSSALTRGHSDPGSADCVRYRVQTGHHYQSLDGGSYPYGGSYFGRMVSDYGSNAVVYPHVATLAPTTAVSVLPLECTEGIVPIYVNAKQYHAILRRRQARAKLEAQNKITKSRKPYLHESRHRHALKRARGSGGRFLNTKNVQESKPSTQTFGKNLILQKTSALNPESRSRWGASTSSGSDISCIFNNDEMFPQLDLGVSLVL